MASIAGPGSGAILSVAVPARRVRGVSLNVISPPLPPPAACHSPATAVARPGAATTSGAPLGSRIALPSSRISYPAAVGLAVAVSQKRFTLHHSSKQVLQQRVRVRETRRFGRRGALRHRLPARRRQRRGADISRPAERFILAQQPAQGAKRSRIADDRAGNRTGIGL